MAQQFFQGQELFPGMSFITDSANNTGFLVNAQGQLMAKRFQTGEQPNAGGLESELQQFGQKQPLSATRPGFGPGFQQFSQEQPLPETGDGSISRRPVFEPGFQGPSGSAGQPPGVGSGPITPTTGPLLGPLRQLPTRPPTPRRVRRSFTEGLTAPGMGVGNLTIGSLLQRLFGNF